MLNALPDVGVPFSAMVLVVRRIVGWKKSEAGRGLLGCGEPLALGSSATDSRLSLRSSSSSSSSSATLLRSFSLVEVGVSAESGAGAQLARLFMGCCCVLTSGEEEASPREIEARSGSEAKLEAVATEAGGSWLVSVPKRA